MAKDLRRHDVETVRDNKSQGLKNGELLRRAKEAGFEILITADQNLEYQQKLSRTGLGVIVVRAKSTRIQDLIALVPEILDALESITARQVAQIG